MKKTARSKPNTLNSADVEQMLFSIPKKHFFQGDYSRVKKQLLDKISLPEKLELVQPSGFATFSSLLPRMLKMVFLGKLYK